MSDKLNYPHEQIKPTLAERIETLEKAFNDLRQLVVAQTPVVTAALLWRHMPDDCGNETALMIAEGLMEAVEKYEQVEAVTDGDSHPGN